MILTNCAACAAPLAHDAPRCVRCKVRYCDSTCQHDHWRRGHKQMCKKIHRGGNAEQYHADKKYKEAVAVAVEACAADTKGQTCYICTQALHWKTKEGLVRMCACRGTAGFVHVSCLAEQVKILVAESEEKNLDKKARDVIWARWYDCSLCKQSYHGVVYHALGWACWKTYVGRPEGDWTRVSAMTQLGNGLFDGNHYADALTVQKAQLSTLQRYGTTEHCVLIAKGNLSNTYDMLGRDEETMRLRREVYSGFSKLIGEESPETLWAASNLVTKLVAASEKTADPSYVREAKRVLRKIIPVARRVLGENDQCMISMKINYARALYADDSATLDDLRESVTSLEETAPIARRVFGGAHPLTSATEVYLRCSRETLRARETPSPEGSA